MSDPAVVVVNTPDTPPVDSPVVVVTDPAVANLAEKVEELTEATKAEETNSILSAIGFLASEIKAGFTLLTEMVSDVRSATVVIADDVGKLPDVPVLEDDGEVKLEEIPEVPLTADEKAVVEEVTERTSKKRSRFI